MNLKYYLRGLGVGFIVCALVLGIHHFRKNDSSMTDDQIRARAEQLGMVEASSRLTDNDVPDAEELLESIDEPAPPEKEEIPAEPAGEDADIEAVQDEALAESKDDVTDVPMDDVTSEISQEVTDDPDAVKVDTNTSDNAENADASESSGNAGQTAGNDGSADTANDQTAGNDAGASDTASESSSKPEGNTAATGDSQAASDNSPAASDIGNTNVVGGQITIVSGDSSYRVAQKLEDAGIVASASAYDLYLCNNGYDRYIRTGSFNIPAGSSDQDIAKMITGR